MIPLHLEKFKSKTQSIYEQHARLNEEIAKIAHTEAPEWAIIMYFYAALHWVNDYAYKTQTGTLTLYLP